jgi:UDP-N-acetylmuramoyl-tripeptide--D-alanyl-D-alanine ligase
VAAALSPLGPILKTPANRNTEYTVPLIWPELDERHRAVVVEMAMRGFHQIEHLASFCRPTFGIVTNIGYSHLEMVGSRQGIAQAKGELLQALPSDGVALLWSEDEFLSTLSAMAPGVVKTFGFSENADCRIVEYLALNWGHARIVGHSQGLAWEAVLPAVGRHIATGAAAAILTAQECGIDLDQAAAALSTVELPPMRMEIREVEGVTYLLDTYNASPASMIAALETIAEMESTGSRRAVIGEMRELGELAEESHRTVGLALKRLNLHDVLFYGESTHWAREALGAGEVTHSIEDARAFVRDSKPGDVVLIKGSRSLELERVLQ